MNPPYSRTRGGQSAFDLKGLTKQERKRCQKTMGPSGEEENPRSCAPGWRHRFLCLPSTRPSPERAASDLCCPSHARLPTPGRNTRRMVESEFRDIVVIATASGASLQHVGFSADTGMEEMLLVATRRKNPREEPRSPGVMLHCVTLYEPCIRNGEAGEVARAIRKAEARCVAADTTHPVTVGNGRIGCVTTMRASGHGSPWNMVGVTHGGLALAADALTRGVLDHIVGTPIPLGLEMGTIEEVFDVGPTHHLLGHPKGASPIGAFEFHPVASKTDATGADRALWKADSKEQRSLRVLPTHKGLSPPEVGSDGAARGDEGDCRPAVLCPKSEMDQSGPGGRNDGTVCFGREGMDCTAARGRASSKGVCALVEFHTWNGGALDTGATDAERAVDDANRSIEEDPLSALGQALRRGAECCRSAIRHAGAGGIASGEGRGQGSSAPTD